MGLAYIKLAQMLAMQDIKGLFTEQDRKDIACLCDAVNPIPWRKIKYQIPDTVMFRIRAIVKKPLGSASISQVHLAQLDTGELVALKIKRHDVARNLRHDVKCLRILLRVFGPIFGFTNHIGGDKALSCCYDWILREIDFVSEAKNISEYGAFAESVNGKVKGCVDIRVPMVYEDLCTPDIIVMEYVPYKTINTGEFSHEQVLNAINSYIKLSFYSMYHEMPVIFHGDPHAGNIYIDDDGNIGFLDMGLIFRLDAKDLDDVRQLFLCACFGDSKSLCRLLAPWFTGNAKQWNVFRREVEFYCERVHARPLTAYFMDLALVCRGYNIKPATYLFEMAKAFVCLSGFDNSYGQELCGNDLVLEQTIEYCRKAGKERRVNYCLLV